MSSLTINFPSRANILNITNSNPAIVTTDSPHGYYDFILLTVVIPYPNVMQEINGNTYIGLILNNTTIVLANYIIGNFTVKFLDTTKLTAFSTGPTILITPPPPAVPYYAPAQKAQLVPAGEMAITLKNASDVVGPNNPQ